LADFSGYLTMDELYDGPFCILSIVDNRNYKRLFYQVLEHDPNQLDMLAFVQRFQTVLQARQLTVLGITTDGSNLYPAALAAVFPGVPHQICEFHILKELNQALLRVDALGELQPRVSAGAQATGGPATQAGTRSPARGHAHTGPQTPTAAAEDRRLV
jgi:hypothetical protein